MKLAVIQMEPVFGDVEGNLATSLEKIREAAEVGANLIVLPELVISGYMFESRAEAARHSETAGTGPATSAWTVIANDLDVIVVGGFAEQAGQALYNSAFMAIPGQRFELYRKVHLWDEEALYFEPGDRGFPVVQTNRGRIGMMICYDGWFPECYRSMALRGADIICVPTNWVPIPGQRPGEQAMANILTMAAAHSNGLIVAAADRVGAERGQQFIGQSLIVTHTGWPVAGPASDAGQCLLTADVNVSEARRSRCWGNFNNPVRDRRPSEYAIDM